MLRSDPESFDRVIEVNLLGSVRVVRAFLPLLVAGRGYYLQISSLAAIAPAPMLSSYAASKAGVEAFAVALRVEVAHHGVDVGVAYLSFTDTDMTRAGRSFNRPEQAADDDGPADGDGPAASDDDLRQELPGGVARLYPLEAAIDRLVAGIERRSPFVYGQSFIRWVRPWRWLLPSLTYLGGRRIAVRLEQQQQEQGPQAVLPVGAGGQADIAARSARSARAARSARSARSRDR
jgi:NAD(P)-dependent dehydrogenase (short-subunit alcohol dehydrogenase family)